MQWDYCWLWQSNLALHHSGMISFRNSSSSLWNLNLSLRWTFSYLKKRINDCHTQVVPSLLFKWGPSIASTLSGKCKKLETFCDSRQNSDFAALQKPSALLTDRVTVKLKPLPPQNQNKKIHWNMSLHHSVHKRPCHILHRKQSSLWSIKEEHHQQYHHQ